MMELDLAKLLDGGPTVWIVFGVVLFLLARNNKDGGISNLHVELLQSILNAPAPDELSKADERVRAVVKLSNHLRDQDDEKNADGLLSFLPALTRKGKKNDPKG